MVTLLRRELAALLLAPQSYAIAAAYVVISGVFFINLIDRSDSPDLASYFANIGTTLIVLAPIMATLSVAEQRRNGSLETTLSWPISRTSLILAKFTAITLYIWVLMSVCWIYVVQLASVATPEPARAVGGYIGLALLAMFFNGVAMAVASRASSISGSAFVGFGLLLMLWVVQYVPDPWREWIEPFGPIYHMEPMQRGLLYTTDVLYFVLGTAIGLAVARWSLRPVRTGFARSLVVKRVAAVAVVIGVILGTPPAVATAGGSWDLTGTNRETLSETSRGVLATVEEPITITGFIDPLGIQANELTAVVRRYENAGANVEQEIIDPDVSPGLARAAGVTDYISYQIRVGSRTQRIPDLSETTVTTAISTLSEERPPRACFTIGHGEREINDVGPEGLQAFTARLRIIGYEPRQIALAAAGAGEELSSCTVVLIVGPRSGFLGNELRLLAGYLKDEGKLIVAADGIEGDVPTRQLNALIAPWGLQFGNTLVHDYSSLAGDPRSIVVFDFPSLSPVVQGLDQDNIPVVLPNAVPIGRAQSVGGAEQHITDLLQSSPASAIGGTGSSQETGPFLLSAISESSWIIGTSQNAKAGASRVAVLGGADIATNRYKNTFGGQEYMVALTQWVAADSPIIAAYREPGEAQKLTITDDQRQALINRGIVTPTALLTTLVFGLLWRLRRG